MSQITCAVGSVSQGTTDKRRKIGHQLDVAVAGIVAELPVSSGYSPEIVWR